MSFSGAEVTEKGLARGWDPDAQDQEQQRLFRLTQILEAALFRPFAWKPHASLGLRYAFYGGWVVADGSWVFQPGGTVTLANNSLNYIERSAAGVVSVNQTGFSDDAIPMARIEASGGTLLSRTYIDDRPHTGDTAGGSAGSITFLEIVGQILNSQVPLGAVKQYEAQLSIAFTQLTGVAARAQLPVAIAYEDEVNVFDQINTFLTQVRRGIRTITVVDSPYSWQSDDWHLNVDASVGPVQVLVPDAAAHFAAGTTDQLHFKKIGYGSNPLTLSPAVLGQRIDGHTSAIIRRPNRSFTLVSDGGDWWIQ